MHDYDEERDEDFCPNCGLGHLKQGSKPYLKLFHKQLFTIPDALCFECDICTYLEFDQSSIDVVDEMMFGATSHSFEEKPVRRLPHSSEDDLPQCGKPSQF